MSKTCAVCKKGKGPEVCEVCGFTDGGEINKELLDGDAEYWFETVVKPYRVLWEARKREAELLAQLEEAKKREAELLARLNDFANVAARETKPELSTAEEYIDMGNVYFEKGSYDRAIIDYCEAIRLDPNNAAPYYNRGNAYREKGDNDRAIADYSEAIRLDPNDAASYCSRGIAYYNKDDNDRAIADCSEAIRLDSKYAFAYAWRGEAYRMKGQYDNAIRDLTQATLLDPKYAFAYACRGETYRMKSLYSEWGSSGQIFSNRAEAIWNFEKALALDPNLDWVKKELKEIREKAEYDKVIKKIQG